MATTVSPITAEPTSAATYKAAVVHDFSTDLAIEQVPRAPLIDGQVRVKVEASGLCHTDIHAAHGDWPIKPAPPFVPGHEPHSAPIRTASAARSWSRSSSMQGTLSGVPCLETGCPPRRDGRQGAGTMPPDRTHRAP